MSTSFELKVEFPVKPKVLYNAWLNSEQHEAMTGGEAQCSKREGDRFSAWDGYITGKNILLTPHSEIVQKWRTTEFKDSDPDSTLTLHIYETTDGCELTLTHSDIPDDQPNYKDGWHEHYITPMHDYFGSMI